MIDVSTTRKTQIVCLCFAFLSAISAATAQTLTSWINSNQTMAGGSLQLRCSATGPSGLAIRLACPLLAGSQWTTCLEDCRRPLSSVTIPELSTGARCEIQRRIIASSSSFSVAWEEVNIVYEFFNVSQRHEGNYTCIFMLLRSVNNVKVVAAATVATTPSATKTSTRGAMKSTVKPRPNNIAIVDTGNVATATASATTEPTVGIVTTERLASIASPNDWFRIAIYGPITMGHVIVAGLTVVMLLLLASLLLGLVICHCRRLSQKRLKAELMSSKDGTVGWTSSLSGRLPPVGGFFLENSHSNAATLAGADASWTSSPIYADVESSPLISGGRGGGVGGGTREIRQNGFGSQGAGMNSAAVGNGVSGGSFFSRDQVGRHSFHSVRQNHLVHRGGSSTASTAASPMMSRLTPRPAQDSQLNSPPLPSPSSEAVSASILHLVAAQRAEIDRLSQQLRSSQQQIDRLAASHTDLHRCLSSRQLSSSRLRHESGPQAAEESKIQLLEVGAVYASSDALTVETIEEEFEADGTLKIPTRKQQRQRSP